MNRIALLKRLCLWSLGLVCSSQALAVHLNIVTQYPDGTPRPTHLQVIREDHFNPLVYDANGMTGADGHLDIASVLAQRDYTIRWVDSAAPVAASRADADPLSDGVNLGADSAVVRVRNAEVDVVLDFAPTCAVTPDGTATSTSPITFTLTFCAPVTGLTIDGIQITGGTKGNLQATADPAVYTVDVTPSGDGAVTCQALAGAAQSFGINSVASNIASVNYTAAPTPTVAEPTPTPVVTEPTPTPEDIQPMPTAEPTPTPEEIRPAAPVHLTVNLDGPGTVQPADGDYTIGTVVQLTATPDNDDYMFDHWEGDVTGNANPVSVTMDTSKTVTAVFEAKWPPPPWVRHICMMFGLLIGLGICLACSFLSGSKQE